MTSDVSDLKSSIDEIIVANRVEASWSQGYIKADGTIGQDTQSCYTDYILLSDGEWLVEAATGYKAKVAIYNAAKVFQYITVPLSSGKNAFTGVDGNFAHVQVTKESGNILPTDITDEIISILSAPYPMLSSDIKVEWGNIENPDVQKADTAFIRPAPVNLVDLSAVTPGIIRRNKDGVDANASWVTTDYIQVEPGAIYALCIFPGVYYGVGFAGIPVYNERKEQIARVTQSGGSIGAVADRVTITIPDRADAKYIRASYYKTYAENPKRWWECQIFKASAWPTDMFMPYDGSDKIIGVGLETSDSAKYNSLFGKSAMWNGDSICAADNDPQGGWPGRIASANGMMFKNYAVSGGTIAENTTASHSVSATLDTMISAFPDADYVIIEGGTNDADLLGDAGLGTYDADDFSTEYIAALDKNTFSGALESIFYRLATQLKGKHIGYLIPQKMGHTEVLVARRRVYFDRAKAIAQKWGIPVLDLWNDLYFNWRISAHWDQTMTTAENETAGNLYLDGQHLTTTGYSIESPIIAEWMRTF